MRRVGPLAGVPFTVKESTAVEGVPTTFGTERFRHLVAPADAPPMARLRAAGAIPIGHANIPTLILAGMHTRSELFGDTVNPWDSSRTPGGTSGGDAVAVATGMAALGLGNDSGGSVRVPAQFCGVAGLKPSTGRFPADHRVLGPDDPGPASQLLVTDGPLARTVGDLRLAYEVLAGTDPRDPRAVPVPAYGEAIPGPVKVAVVADPGGHGVHPAVRGAIATAADALRDAGYDVREVEDVPRMDEALEAYGRITVTEFAPTWPVVRKLLGKGGDRYIGMAMERTRRARPRRSRTGSESSHRSTRAEGSRLRHVPCPRPASAGGPPWLVPVSLAQRPPGAVHPLGQLDLERLRRLKPVGAQQFGDPLQTAGDRVRMHVQAFGGACRAARLGEVRLQGARELRALLGVVVEQRADGVVDEVAGVGAVGERQSQEAEFLRRRGTSGPAQSRQGVEAAPGFLVVRLMTASSVMALRGRGAGGGRATGPDRDRSPPPCLPAGRDAGRTVRGVRPPEPGRSGTRPRRRAGRRG